MYELGELLKKLRGELSLREAASRSGLSYSYISSLEKGKHPRTGAPIKPTPEILRSLAKAYNYSYEELLKVTGVIDDSVAEQTKDDKKAKFVNDVIQKFDFDPNDEKLKSLIEDAINFAIKHHQKN